MGGDKSGRPCDRKRKMALVVVTSAIFIILAIIAIAAYIMSTELSKAREDWNSRVANLTELCENATTSIAGQLEIPAGFAQVTDDSGAVLFSIRSTDTVFVVRDIPERIKQAVESKLFGGTPVSEFDIDSFITSNTRYGKLLRKTTEVPYTSFIGFQAAKLYCQQTSIKCDDLDALAIGVALSEVFSPEELLEWVISASTYGDVVGIGPASESWFSRAVSELNKWQVEYMAFAYDNPNCDWITFAETLPDLTGGAQTPEEFGFTSSNSNNTVLAIKRAVTEELAALGYDLSSSKLNIRLGIEPTLQKDLQVTLDSGLRHLVSLDSVGNTAVDGSIVTIDLNKGRVTAHVGGRSINKTARQFYLSGENVLGYFDAAVKLFSDDTSITGDSIVELPLDNGGTTIQPVRNVIFGGASGLLGVQPEITDRVTADQVAGFFADLLFADSADGMPSVQYISEIEDATSGEVLYVAPQPEYSYSSSPYIETLSLLPRSYDSPSMQMIDEMESGYLLVNLTKDQLTVGLFGSGVAGYAFTEEDRQACFDLAASSVAGALYRRYSETPLVLDTQGIFAAKTAQVYRLNSVLLQNKVSEYVDYLRSYVIDSPESRAKWEEVYLDYTSDLAQFEGTVDQTSFMGLFKQLDTVRSEKSGELLQFVA